MPLSIANFHTKLDIQDFKLVRKFVIQNINSKFASELVLGLATIIAAGYLYTKQSSENNMTDLVYANIEALANPEDDDDYMDVLCLGWGSVDCYGDWVKTKVINFSLK